MADDKTDLLSEVRDKDFVALPIGTVVGRYEITSVLGRGGFGITYRARDTQLGRDVAIKEYLPTALAIRHDGITVMPSSTKVAEDFTWGRQRFVEEGRTLASLHRAPAIVRVHDFLETNGTAYIVMELVPGNTLEHRLRAGPLSAPDVDTLLWPLLDGLEQVHNEGFLHRDIKPANILLDDKGRPTLIDFGASRAAMVGRTTAMTAVFTPGYAAAEQMTSAKLGPWTDIYGLSATLYHAITGNTPPSAFDRMLEDEYVPLLRAAPVGFSPGLLGGIDAGLAVRAADRPQAIADWRPLLRQASPSSDATIVLHRRENATSGTAAVPPPAQAAAVQRRRPALWAALAVVAVAILGGGAYLAKPMLQGTAVQSMTAEELARALEERQKADAAAIEKKRLEEEAQRQADADAEAKQKADDALAAAQQQRQKAEEDLARLKADMETRRQEEAARREQAAAAAQRALDEAKEKNRAEAEMAALRKADEEAKAQAAAEAESKKQADEEAQRQAEAEAAASRKAEEDARQKAAAEAEAERKAAEALIKAQAERQKADEAAAKQKSDMEARQQTEATAKAQAEADAQAKAEAAEQAKAEAEAKKKAEDDDAAEKKAAEATETSLKLGLLDRQHLQVALTAAGFDTHGADGTFGPRSREMILAWQKAQNEPETGFLTAAQRQALLDNGAAAIRKYDDQQKKIEEDAKKKADDDAKAKAAAEAAARAAPPPNRPPPGQPALPGNFGRRATAGVEIMVGFHANWTEDCFSKPPPVVDLVTPPKNGHVSIRIASDRVNCGKVVQGTGVFYTGNPGFTGSDSFSYDRRGGGPTSSGMRTVTLQVVP